MENNNFKVDEFVKNLKEAFRKDELSFVDEKNEKEQLFKLNKKNIHKALDTLCDSWNKDMKARNFIKHIIGAFYPINSWNKIFAFSEEQIKNKKNKCAITGYYVCGIRDVANYGSSLLIERARIDVATNEEEKQQAIKAFQEKQMTFPVAVRNKNICYSSESSDKFLSLDGAYALTMFVQEMILHDNKEICFTLNKKRTKMFNEHISKRNKLNNKEINAVAKANTFGIIQNEEIHSKLLAIKQELENTDTNE